MRSIGTTERRWSIEGNPKHKGDMIVLNPRSTVIEQLQMVGMAIQDDEAFLAEQVAFAARHELDPVKRTAAIEELLTSIDSLRYFACEIERFTSRYTSIDPDTIAKAAAAQAALDLAVEEKPVEEEPPAVDDTLKIPSARPWTIPDAAAPSEQQRSVWTGNYTPGRAMTPFVAELLQRNPKGLPTIKFLEILEKRLKSAGLLNAPGDYESMRNGSGTQLRWKMTIRSVRQSLVDQAVLSQEKGIYKLTEQGKSWAVLAQRKQT